MEPLESPLRPSYRTGTSDVGFLQASLLQSYPTAAQIQQSVVRFLNIVKYLEASLRWSLSPLLVESRSSTSVVGSFECRAILVASLLWRLPPLLRWSIFTIAGEKQNKHKCRGISESRGIVAAPLQWSDLTAASYHSERFGCAVR